MAAGDIALRLLLTAETGTAISAVSGMGRSIMGTFSGMGNSVGNLVFGFRNLSTAGTVGMDAIKQGVTGLAGGFLSLGAIAGVAMVGVAIALGVTAVKAAGDFQASMTRLVTSAGELPKNLKMVSAGILQMSVDTATSTKQLADGMYYVESSGWHGANALAVLGAAARGAKSENADLMVVTKALTTVMTDYHLPVTQSANAMNGLIAAVQNGKTSLQDLSSSMGAVLPIGSALGISFPQIAGSMDTMTNAGMSARQAAMNLGHVLLALSAPSGVAVKSMAGVGLSAQQVKDALVNKGLPQALQMIEDHVGKEFPKGSVQYETALKNILGGIVGFKTAAMLTGKSLADTQGNIDKITGAMKGSGSAVMGWDAIQQTFNFHMDQAKMAVGAFLIQLGTQLFPVFNQLMGVIFPIIQGFMNWIVQSGIIKTVLQTLVNVITFLVNVGTTLVNFFKNNEVAMAALKAVLITVALIITTVVVAALIIWAIAAWNVAVANIAAFWPIYLVILIIVVVITLVILAVQHWGQIVGWLQGVWSAIAGFFVMLWNGILTGLRAVGQFFVTIWSAIVSFVVGIWNGIVSVARTVWGAISSFFTTIWQAVSRVFMTAWNSIVSFFTTVWNVIKMVAFVLFAVIVAIIIAPFVPLINWFKAHWTQIHAVLTIMWNMIAAAATTVWNAITGFITTAVNAVRGPIVAIWTAISGWLSVAWGAISVVASTVWNAITGFIMTQVNNAKQMITAAWTTISGWLSIAWGAISTVASTVWNTISTNIMKVVNPLKDALGKAWDSVKTGFSNVMNSLAGIASSAWNNVSGAIKSAINALITVIDTMISGVNNVTGTIGIPAIPTIPHLATGGTNLPAGVYWTGENGPELVYLPQGSSVMSHSESMALMSRNSFALSDRGRSQQTVIHPAPVYLDKRQVGEILFTYQQSELRKQGVIRNR